MLIETLQFAIVIAILQVGVQVNALIATMQIVMIVVATMEINFAVLNYLEEGEEIYFGKTKRNAKKNEKK